MDALDVAPRASVAADAAPTPDVRVEQSLDASALLRLVGLPDLPLARAWMCEQLRATNASSDVLSAMASVPRHCFSPASRWRVAYVDLDLWTGATWMTAPRTVARVVDAVPRGPATRVLEIGTGTGYQAAVLVQRGARVTTMDVSPACVAWAAQRLGALGANGATVLLGDGLRAAAGGASAFDTIVVNATLPAVPVALFQPLRATGGVVIAPVGRAGQLPRLLRCAVPTSGPPIVVDLGPCNLPAAVLG